MIWVTTEQGGLWRRVSVHSLLMPDGERWDVQNGWNRRTVAKEQEDLECAKAHATPLV